MRAPTKRVRWTIESSTGSFRVDLVVHAHPLASFFKVSRMISWSIDGLGIATFDLFKASLASVHDSPNSSSADSASSNVRPPLLSKLTSGGMSAKMQFCQFILEFEDKTARRFFAYPWNCFQFFDIP